MPKTFTLPYGCKPSAGCSPDGTRPVLCHGHLKRRDDGLWLLATDAYIAIALKLDGDAEEGWVPFEVLKKMETREARRGKLTFEQLDAFTWKVSNGDESIVTTYTAKSLSDASKFPKVDEIADGLLFGGYPSGKKSAPFGFDPELLARVGLALGAKLRVEVSEPMKPIRLTALGYESDRLAIQMPIRLLEERHGEMKAAA